jgi:hypothetical protein
MFFNNMQFTGDDFFTDKNVCSIGMGSIDTIYATWEAEQAVTIDPARRPAERR